jgi:hypothetical protein
LVAVVTLACSAVFAVDASPAVVVAVAVGCAGVVLPCGTVPVSAAAVADVAAMAAAAIASGPAAPLVGGGVVGTMTGVVGTAMAVAIAFCTVTAALCAVAALESVVAAVVVVELSELLSVDLPSLGFVLDDLLLPCWAALALPLEFAPELLSTACPPAGAEGLV